MLPMPSTTYNGHSISTSNASGTHYRCASYRRIYVQLSAGVSLKTVKQITHALPAVGKFLQLYYLKVLVDLVEIHTSMDSDLSNLGTIRIDKNSRNF